MRSREVITALALTLTGLSACTSGSGTAGPTNAASTVFTGRTITIGLPDDLPGFGVGSNDPTGFDANLAEVISKRFGKPLTTTNLEAGQRDAALLGTAEKEVELVIAAYSITQSRLDKGLIFAGLYMKSPQSFLVRSDDDTVWDRESIATKVVCAIDGTTGEAARFPETVNLITQKRMTDCVRLLKEQEVDAVFDDEVILWGHQDRTKGKMTVVRIESIGQQQYYGIGLRAQDVEECAAVSAVVNDYVRSTQWRKDFTGYLPSAGQTYTRPQKDFEDEFKPTSDEVAAYSCTTSIG